MADTLRLLSFSRRNILREGRRLYFHFEIRPSISVGRLPGLTFAAWELVLAWICLGDVHSGVVSFLGLALPHQHPS